jgi:hypothetical protein
VESVPQELKLLELVELLQELSELVELVSQELLAAVPDLVLRSAEL